MGILSKVFGTQSEIKTESAVLLDFAYTRSTDLRPLFALTARVAAAIDTARVGEYDGYEVAQ